MLKQSHARFIATHIRMVRKLQTSRILPPWRINVPVPFYLQMCEIVRAITHADKVRPVRRFIKCDVYVVVDPRSLVPKFANGMPGPEWWKIAKGFAAGLDIPVDYEPPELVEQCRVRGRNPAWWDPKKDLTPT